MELLEAFGRSRVYLDQTSGGSRAAPFIGMENGRKLPLPLSHVLFRAPGFQPEHGKRIYQSCSRGLRREWVRPGSRYALGGLGNSRAQPAQPEEESLGHQVAPGLGLLLEPLPVHLHHLVEHTVAAPGGHRKPAAQSAAQPRGFRLFLTAAPGLRHADTRKPPEARRGPSAPAPDRPGPTWAGY